MKTTLPKKCAKPLKIEWLIQQPLWKILTIAITDMRKQERAPRSRIDMGEWFRTNGECVACAAGSVLRWSCGINSNARYEQCSCDDGVLRLRYAIDELRLGNVNTAMRELGRQLTKESSLLRCDIRSYSMDRDGFWEDIRALQKRLRAANI